jgi:beta-N-acetylhexosaminidase
MIELSIGEKIGQLIIPRLDLLDPDFDSAFAEHLIKEFHIGSFIVFGGEIHQVVDTLNHLQRISKHPILFSADLERGLGQQVKGATDFPYFMGLAEASKRESILSTYDAAKITAVESRAVGIHLNFSPVLDINNNPGNPIINIRSFGDDAETVRQCGLSYITGLQENGMLATCKHFPGHGDTTVDSHKDLPSLPHSLARLEQTEFLPFRSAISKGVASVMAGHIAIPSLDPSGLPASMSKKILTGLIRENWKYDGLIVTDALMMGAIADNFSEEEAITKVFEAGADQFLIPLNTENAYRILYRLVENHTGNRSRLDRSVNRIIHAKMRLGLFENRFVDPGNAKKIVGSKEHTQIAREITRQCFIIKKGKWPENSAGDQPAIWLIKTDPGSLPYLKKIRGMAVFETELTEDAVNIPDLADYKKVIVITDVKPMAWQKKYLLPDVLRIALDKLFSVKDHFLISCGNPYIDVDLKHLINFVCTYNSGSMAQEEILKRLMNNDSTR